MSLSCDTPQIGYWRAVVSPFASCFGWQTSIAPRHACNLSWSISEQILVDTLWHDDETQWGIKGPKLCCMMVHRGAVGARAVGCAPCLRRAQHCCRACAWASSWLAPLRNLRESAMTHHKPHSTCGGTTGGEAFVSICYSACCPIDPEGEKRARRAASPRILQIAAHAR
jgi:hypothetical protein